MGERKDKKSWLYGFNPVLEAIKAGRKIQSLYISKQRNWQIQRILELAEEENIPVEFVEKSFFDTRFHKGHQGIAAVVLQKNLLSIEDLFSIVRKKEEKPFFLILDGIEDPRNFGAILRVADAAGIQGVIIQSRRSVGLTPVVSKTSAGALEYVNLCEVVNIKHAIEKMKEYGITIIGAEADSPLTIWDVDMNTPLCLIIGSEGRGIRKTVKERCNYIVSLPMKGTVNSLNVSVACGILAYEVIRQRITLKQK